LVIGMTGNPANISYSPEVAIHPLMNDFIAIRVAVLLYLGTSPARWGGASTGRVLKNDGLNFGWRRRFLRLLVLWRLGALLGLGTMDAAAGLVSARTSARV
jgi:hypothetical protein